MNRSFLVALLSVVMLVLMSPASHAWDTIVPPHGFCDSCHALQSTNNTPGSVAGCVSCHSSTGFATRTPVGDRGAMSNRFGTTADEPAKGSKSTHNYKNFTFTPTYQKFPYPVASKAAEPLGGPLNDPLYNTNGAGVLACQRCHNVHNETRNVTVGVDKPFLRESNSGDEMCRDCHLSRWNTTTQQGSHPVAYRPYSTVYKQATTAFRRVPTTPNPANYTSKMGNYLKNGKVVCSTCHSVHYGDSNSATLDNRSTANGSILGASLKSSTGTLLRTDAYGPNADETNINICSSCHKETKNRSHNGQHQNLQCMNCHSAHVDYNADSSDPNMYLLRRTLNNVSTGTMGRITATLRYNAQSGMNFKNFGQGICEVCHTPPPGVTPEHDLSTATYANCVQCHDHKNGFSGGGCNTCHGQPPMGTTADKAATGYTKYVESQTPHKLHAGNVVDSASYAFTCKECHYETKPMTNIALHAKGSFQDIFTESVGTIGTKAGFPNLPGNYQTDSTCATVYCHSNGNPRPGGVGSIVYQPPRWSDPPGSITQAANHCDRCHGGLAGGAAPINTNAHSRHVTGYNIKCVTCHNYTVDASNQITGNGKMVTHANGVKDIAFVSLLGSFNTTDATCSVKCHSDGVSSTPAPLRAPIWTELAQNKGPAYCGSCHAAAPATKLHTVHLTGAKGPLIGTASSVCDTCHIYSDGAATHANGSSVNDLKPNTCATCHPSGSPIWVSGQTVSCESCHVNNVSTVTNSSGTYSTTNLQVNVFAQSRHARIAGVDNTCTLVCHSSTAAHIGAAQTGEKRLQAFAGVQQCNQCHLTASSSTYKAQSSARLDIPSHGGLEAGYNAFAHYTSKASNNLSKSCAACHDPHSTSKYMIRATINGIQIKPLTNMSTGFIDRDFTDGVYNGLCQVCHTKTNHFRKNSFMGAVHNQDKWCLNCHDHKGTKQPGTFAFAPNADCNGCHGFPPVQSMTVAGIGQLGSFTRYSGAVLQNYSGGGGAHTVEGHVSKSLRMIVGNSACTNCHFGTSHNQGNGIVTPSKVNVQVDPQFRFNKDLPITYDGVQSDNRALFKVGSCSNVSCHFQVTPKWSTQKN